MSLRKAQKHMRRAAELLNQGQLGFGGEKRKLESLEEGITCYADADVLKMLGWEPKNIHEFGMNLKWIRRGTSKFHKRFTNHSGYADFRQYLQKTHTQSTENPLRVHRGLSADLSREVSRCVMIG